MDIYLLQSLCLVGLFGSMVTLTLLPSQFLRRHFNRTSTIPTKFETLMGFANCLSGGVFLATFFVGLLPEVRREVTDIMAISRIASVLPVTEVVVMLGFFLAVFVEQFALSAKERAQHGHSHSATDGLAADLNGGAASSDKRLTDGKSTSTTSLAPESLTVNGAGADVVVDGDDAEYDDDRLLSPVEISPRALHVNSHGEHGHSHNVEDLLVSTSRLRFGILLFSLGVHSLFEGMALGLQTEAHTLLNLFLGVWIHECLIAFALGFAMVKLEMTTCRLWQTAAAFSGLIPFGQIVGLAIGGSRSWTGRVLGAVLQALAAGTFIQVTFLDIIPDGLGRNDSTPHRLLKVTLLFLGFVLIAGITILVKM